MALSITLPGRHIPLPAIRDAANCIYAAAFRTPLVRLEGPGPMPDLYLKLELLQPIGSFKIRGAYNVVRQLSPADLRDGVWTVSAGNAAQGVALAARTVGARCSVMVMDTAPQTKLDAIQRLGASIVKATYFFFLCGLCLSSLYLHADDELEDIGSEYVQTPAEEEAAGPFKIKVMGDFVGKARINWH